MCNSMGSNCLHQCFSTYVCMCVCLLVTPDTFAAVTGPEAEAALWRWTERKLIKLHNYEAYTNKHRHTHTHTENRTLTNIKLVHIIILILIT